MVSSEMVLVISKMVLVTPSGAGPVSQMRLFVMFKYKTPTDHRVGRAVNRKCLITVIIVPSFTNNFFLYNTFTYDAPTDQSRAQAEN